MKPRAFLVFLAIGVLSLPACSGGSNRETSPAGDSQVKPLTLVTIGDSATEGDGVPDRYRSAWPYVLFEDSFPRASTFVNAALDSATVADAASQQEPIAKEVNPDVVAIWLGAVDLAQHTPIESFRADLRKLIDDLERSGSRRILVADLPSAYPGAAPYNVAIRSVAHATNSTLVELSGAKISLDPTDGLPDQPDAASHLVIAHAFEHALPRSP